MKINVKNEAKVMEAIKKSEGKAYARTIKYDDVVYMIDVIENRLNNLGMLKKDRIGSEFRVNFHSQRFAHAYKYTAYSTIFKCEYCSSGWFITSVYRWPCSNERICFMNELLYKKFYKF